MKKKILAITALIVILTFALTIILPVLRVFGSSAKTTQEKIDNTTKIKNELRKKINSKETEKIEEIKEKNNIETEILSLDKEIKSINLCLKETKAILSQKENELKNFKKIENEEWEKFKERVRIIYESNELTYLEMIFSSEDLNDLFRKIDTLMEISKYDKNLLDNMEKTEKKIIETKLEIQNKKTKQENMNKLVSFKINELENKKKEKLENIKEFKRDIETFKKKFEEAEKAETYLKRQLSQILSKKTSATSKTTNKGEFLWPIPSCRSISSPYGFRIHPILKTKLFHSGIDIPAQYGSNVVCAKDGIVVFSGWNGGYGLCVIIDHEDGTSTLYGHLSYSEVKKGQKVIAGERIGKTGSTGLSNGPHIHFEIMLNGINTNPSSYF
ncbi:MAG: peptidoglycan DD-metalloendopeptidase family protein [Clostridiales bacterium]|jgi:murein DD-endopeptidase MepM/ murein hydrolase activator NlpD|nr:peptidoglycan DD-metalloendopeptidase family protein [Clostridiales bacterium]